jgi:hypothetical protein
LLSNLDYIASNKNEWWIGKYVEEVNVTLFKLLSRHLPGRTVSKHEKHHTE